MNATARNLGRSLVVIVPAVALSVAAIPRDAARMNANPAACTATLSPDTVNVQSDPVTVGYTLSEDIGKLTSATADKNSGLEVSGLDAMAKTVQVKTGSASEGDWAVNFLGDQEATCTGTLTVRKAGASLH